MKLFVGVARLVAVLMDEKYRGLIWRVNVGAIRWIARLEGTGVRNDFIGDSWGVFLY